MKFVGLLKYWGRRDGGKTKNTITIHLFSQQTHLKKFIHFTSSSDLVKRKKKRKKKVSSRNIHSKCVFITIKIRTFK